MSRFANKTWKKLVYEGVEYESLAHVLRAHGRNGDSANIKVYISKYGYSLDEAVRHAINCETRGSMEERAIKRAAKKYEAKKSAEHAAFDKSMLKRRNLYKQFLSKIKLCEDCDAPFVKCAGCGSRCEKCRIDYYLEKKKKSRKTRDRGKISKRHKTLGMGTWQSGITAMSVAIRDGMICVICKNRVEKHLGKGWQPRGWSIGHIIPVSAGGDTVWGNVQCECIECNVKKGVSTELNQEAA
jgi:hypothetical protein